MEAMLMSIMWMNLMVIDIKFVPFFYLKSFVLTCDCRLLKSKDIPCCHSISILKEHNIHEIPSTCIVQWWKKDVNVPDMATE